jgi:hypothetical protein
LNLKSIQIQTLNFILILKLNSKAELLNWAVFPFPVRSSRPNPLQIAAHQTNPNLATFSPADSLGPRVGQPLTPILTFLSPASDSHRNGRPVPRPCARDGTPSPSGWPARRETGARAHASRTRPREGFTPFAPATRAPATWHARRRAVPPQPPGRSKPGQHGVFAATPTAPGFKGKGKLRPRRPSHQPLWGFPFLLLQ